MRYELIIYWSKEDHAFLVEVSEHSGCMSDGATSEEAVANAQTVIAEWIETAKAPGLVRSIRIEGSQSRLTSIGRGFPVPKIRHCHLRPPATHA